ncbi:MAG TPA: hypothetical protein VMT10_07760 [Solirubrobacteraceae bacterium]|nr:hypothetical protein [Solirubrobacteraceae bacterium]
MSTRRSLGLVLAALAASATCGGVAAADQPVITAKLSGTAGDGGWFTSPVTIQWSAPDATDTSGCDTVTLKADTTGTPVTCHASNADGESQSTRVIRIDTTPPVVTAAMPDRPPDANGWYVRPVTVSFSAVDTTSGLQSCTPVTYAGPDSALASLSGTCRDVAGNVSAPFAFALKYDATPPAAPVLRAVPGDASAALSWAPSPDTVRVQISRSPGLLGAAATALYAGSGSSFNDSRLTNGTRYSYTVTAFDDAGNASSAAISVVPEAPPLQRLASRSSNHRLARPPQLRWRAVAGARYYNVQVFRGHTKVLSAWPRRARMLMHRSWLYRGHTRRLSPGSYTWYVWPGFGRLGARRYGKLLGRNTFVIVAA